MPAHVLDANALSDVDSVEDLLGITASASQRDAITRIINGVTQAMENYTGRNLLARNYTPDANPDDAIYDGNGRFL